MEETQAGNQVYFSDIFEVEHSVIEEYGALDISLVCDNPAFVDPFLLFANPKYKKLHNFVIEYLRFLRNLATREEKLNDGTFNHYYKFPEVKEVWLGYTVSGNAGLGLGKDFATSLYGNLHKIFSKFGDEGITESSHLEKLCLVEDGIGVDKISDFTLNLIKSYLLEYTQVFAQRYLNPKYLKEFSVRKVRFNFEKGLWEDGRYMLPLFEHDNKREFILLVPREILTKEETWISKNDFLQNDSAIFNTILNEELREKVNKFFRTNLATKLNKKKQPETDYSPKSRKNALLKTVWEYPEVLDYYIKYKEQGKKDAIKYHVADPDFVNFFPDTEAIQTEFRNQNFGRISSLNDCIARISFFKKTLESNSNALYIKGAPLKEKQLQLIFKMTTYNSLFDYNSEVNNGHGAIDFIVSYGSADKTGLELKLASNTKLKPNLLNQGRVYEVDGNLKHVIKIIFYFSDEDLGRVHRILDEVNKVVDNYEIFLVDCRKKKSASNQR